MKLWELLQEDVNQGSNISVLGTERAQLMKKYKIEPGTEEWFKLWFAKPLLTGEKPFDRKSAKYSKKEK